MSMGHAARVGDPIAHHDQSRALAIGVSAAFIGAAILFTASMGGVPLLLGAGAGAGAAEIAAALGFGAHFGGTALTLANRFRSSERVSVHGHIVSGVSRTFIGVGSRQAANASMATRVDCHASFVSEGSSTIVVEGGHASRQGDHTACGGTVADGCSTVVFGGAPTGGGGAEANSRLFSFVSNGFSIAAPSASLGRATVLRWLGGQAAERVGAGIAAVELTGALAATVAPDVGKPIGAAGNSVSLARRWYQLGQRRGYAEWIEAILRYPGTPTRIESAMDAVAAAR